MSLDWQRIADRFWVKVLVDGDCWLWQAATRKDGYGRFGVEAGNVEYAHRVAYRLLLGVWPPTELDHLCRRRNCVNPDHLEPVPSGVNSARGAHPNHLARRRGVCRRGHPLTPENVSLRGDGRPRCRTCAREQRRARVARRVAGGEGRAYIWFWRLKPNPDRGTPPRLFDRDRKGERCRVLARGAMNSALVEFEDGYRVVTSRSGLRRAEERA